MDRSRRPHIAAEDRGPALTGAVVRSVAILHKLPTPYNDHLFRALAADPRIELRVFHMWRGSWRRPWKTPLGTGYPNRYFSGRLGLNFVKAAWEDRRSLFIIGDWGHAPSIVAIIVRLARRAPVALWTDTPQEQLPRPPWRNTLRRALLRFLLRRVDAVLGSGRSAHDALREMGAPEASLVDLQFSVDLDRPSEAGRGGPFTDRVRRLRTEHTGPSTCLFATFGTLVEKKGHDLAIEALSRVRRAGHDVRLVLAGEGPDRPMLERRVEELGLRADVDFLGWIEPEETEVVYAAADVVVHPSRYDPFPLVVLEAMAWGVPVIGSDTCGSVTERIRDGHNGVSVPAGDVTALAAAMTALARDPELRDRMGIAARETAESWPVERNVSIIVGLAEKLVEPSGPRR